MSTSTIYGLTYELSHQNGRSIIFREQNNSKLTEDNLHGVQLKMMQSTQIPHVLPLSVENIDLKTKFHYDITSKNKVLAFFRNHTTSMSDYYQVLLSIIKTIESSSSYMLDQENFILNPDFIFIGESPSDVYLTYIPVTGLKKKETLIDEMKQVLTDVASEVEGLQGNEFKSILNYIKDSSFSLPGLKKLVLELISLRSNINQVSFNQQQNIQGNMNDQQPVNKQNMPPEQPTQKVASPKTKKKVKKKLPPLTSREGTYLIVAAILFIGISWKLYDINQIPAMLIVSSSLTVIILVAVIVYWKIWRPGVKPIVTEETVEENEPTPKQPQQPQVNQQNHNFNNTNQFSASQSQMNQGTQMPIQNDIKTPSGFDPTPILSDQIAATSSMDTVLLDQFSEDTVLLEDEDDVSLGQEEQQEVLPMLVKLDSTGQEENIMITQSNFLIGRNAESVNYAEDTVGISRIHAEIVKIDQHNYALKDLGSKNGSKLNGELIVPYKVHALNEDDKIELGKAIYTFKWSQSK